MALDSSLELNFRIKKANVADVKFAGSYAVITHKYAASSGKADEVVTLYYDEGDILQNEKYYFLCYKNIAAKEMGDTIEVVVYNAEGEAISEVKQDSVKNFAMSGLNTAGLGEEMYTMLADMLFYGESAQKNFNYDTDNLVTADMTEEQKAKASTNVTAEAVPESSGCYLKTTVALESQIEMNVYLNYNEVGMYAIVNLTDHNGNKVEKRLEQGDMLYNGEQRILTVNDMVIADYATKVTVTVYDKDGNQVGKVVDSIECYVKRAQDSDKASQIIKELTLNLMKFGVSSYNYFH